MQQIMPLAAAMCVDVCSLRPCVVVKGAAAVAVVLMRHANYTGGRVLQAVHG
jgi:hypothetical protein